MTGGDGDGLRLTVERSYRGETVSVTYDVCQPLVAYDKVIVPEGAEVDLPEALDMDVVRVKKFSDILDEDQVRDLRAAGSDGPFSRKKTIIGRLLAILPI